MRRVNQFANGLGGSAKQWRTALFTHHTNMKPFIVIWALVLAGGRTLAASPHEESRFLDAVRFAYSSKDKDAILALQCWDGVDNKTRELFARFLPFTVPTNEVVSVRYTTNYHIGFYARTNNGVVLVPNLTPTKRIQIDFKTPPPALNIFMGLSVGEKNGKLMIVHDIPEKEARFVAATKEAFEKHDAEALMRLTCWDRVPEKFKERGRKNYVRDAAQTATDITLTEPDPNYPDLEWKDKDGVSYRSNIPVVKQLKIRFSSGTRIETKLGNVEVRDAVYPVGEKDGKLYLLEPAPVK